MLVVMMYIMECLLPDVGSMPPSSEKKQMGKYHEVSPAWYTRQLCVRIRISDISSSDVTLTQK